MDEGQACANRSPERPKRRVPKEEPNQGGTTRKSKESKVQTRDSELRNDPSTEREKR